MTTPITLTGPDTCAQCGAEFDLEALAANLPNALAGGEDLTALAYVVIRGHKIPVPGLYWDAACGSQIESGELESTLTLEAAQAFLDDIWGPRVAEAGVLATALGDGELASQAAKKLVDILEVSLILETVIEALNEGSDLSWLPECHGHSHGDQAAEVDPRSVAHLN